MMLSQVAVGRMICCNGLMCYVLLPLIVVMSSESAPAACVRYGPVGLRGSGAALWELSVLGLAEMLAVKQANTTARLTSFERL